MSIGTDVKSLASGGTITGSLVITGDLDVQGDLNFGDASTDTLDVNGQLHLKGPTGTSVFSLIMEDQVTGNDVLSFQAWSSSGQSFSFYNLNRKFNGTAWQLMDDTTAGASLQLRGTGTSDGLALYTFASGSTTQSLKFLVGLDGIVELTPSAITSVGTDSFGMKLSQTLNDTGAAGGTDTYYMFELDLTDTDTTGANEWGFIDFVDATGNEAAIDLTNGYPELILGESGGSEFIAYHDGTNAVVTNNAGGLVLNANSKIITLGESPGVGSPRVIVRSTSGGDSRLELGEGSGTTWEMRTDGGFDQAVCAVGDTVGNQLVITNLSNVTKDHDHATDTNPTLYIHSDTDPDTDNTEWISLSHNTNLALIDSGKGGIYIVGGQTREVTTVNAATYDLDYDDYILHVTYTGTGAVTSLTLLTAQTTQGRVLKIKDAGGNAATNTITIDTEGSETIDGSATYVMNTDYQAIELYSDGSNWFVI